MKNELKNGTGAAIRPFSRLYVHVPFCEAKCAYCSFYSEPKASAALKKLYFEKLREDFAANADSCGELGSVYIGGGTPTSLSSGELKQLFAMISTYFKLCKNHEFSIECNPETLDVEKAALLAGNVNRVSLGVQSFDEAHRRILGRLGSPENARQAISLLRAEGLGNLGLDLIYAIPGQSAKDWQWELREAVGLGISHLSAYALTIEEGSRLAVDSSLELPDDELAAEMWEIGGDFLQNAGLPRYEISNYARPGFECRHNDAIWHGATYLGCGPAASSFDGIHRWTQMADLLKWSKGESAEVDDLASERRARELFVMGLRTVSGWNAEEFSSRTGRDFRVWENEWMPLVEEKLLVWTDGILRPARRGMLCWDGMAEILL